MTSSQDIEQSLNREFAEAWRPDTGDKLIGRIAEISAREGAYGPYPIVTVRRDAGDELAFHAFHVVAKKELAEARPQVGEQIAILYRGQRDATDGRSKYHAYRVVMPERPPAAFAWSEFDDAAGAEPEPDVPIEPVGTLEEDGGDELPF